MRVLQKRGIGTQVHYIPLHFQPYYQKRYGFCKGDFPKAKLYYERALSLPMYASLSEEKVCQVVESIKKILKY